MTIWVDADACPGPIREILFRAAERTRTPVTLVANQRQRVPASRLVTCVTVSPGFDVADNEIVRRLTRDDLVITSDIPLAAEVIEKGGHALSPRGEWFNPNTIRERLTMRDFMDTLRASGIHSGGPAPLNLADRKTFSGHLDRYLAHHDGTNPGEPGRD